MLNVAVNTDGLDAIAEKLKRRAAEAEKAVAKQAKADTDPFVPAKTGNLSGGTQVRGNLIVYPGPYARFLYYGKLMVDPNTGSPWASAGTKKVLTDKNLVFSKAVHGRAQAHWFEASMAQNLKKWIKTAGGVITGGK